MKLRSKRAAPDSEREPAPRSSHSRLRTESTVDAPRESTLLIVGGELGHRSQLARALVRPRRTVLIAENGDEAQNTIRRFPVDAVLADLDDPERGIALHAVLRLMTCVPVVIAWTESRSFAQTILVSSGIDEFHVLSPRATCEESVEVLERALAGR